MLNPRGGAIAFGHPLGASGCRLMTTLINQLEAVGGHYGLQTMCEAGGVVGMTIVAARDPARRLIRVTTIAPSVFDTPYSAGCLRTCARLAEAVPHPSRLGVPEEYASLAAHIISNPMINGETIRLDGALRMAPK